MNFLKILLLLCLPVVAGDTGYYKYTAKLFI